MNREDVKLTPWTLFLHSFMISLFSFGGGSTILSLQQKSFVEKNGWLDEADVLEMFTIAQSAPGATSVNTSILIGYRLLGLKGALICTLATALPPLIVITLITAFYSRLKNNQTTAYALRAVRACAAALMASVSVSLLTGLLKKKDLFLTIVWICTMAVMLIFNPNTIIVILAGIIIGILHLLFISKRLKKAEKP